ncbi:DNA polymerase delta subunit 3 [Balamuthia mandrillaris]
MAEDDMYLDNLEEWVCEHKKQVTYKWLSNTLQVPSNVAKQMLFAFAEKKGAQVQTVYLLSGKKKADQRHTITLVPQAQLEEMRKIFEEISSLHVYSVQAVLPKDSAEMWAVDNALQSELFAKGGDLSDNPILSNRWSAIACAAAKERVIIKQPPQEATKVEDNKKLPQTTKARISLPPVNITPITASSSKQTTTTTSPEDPRKKKQQQQSDFMRTYFTKAGEGSTSANVPSLRGARIKKEGTMDAFLKKAAEQQKVKAVKEEKEDKVETEQLPIAVKQEKKAEEKERDHEQEVEDKNMKMDVVEKEEENEEDDLGLGLNSDESEEEDEADSSHRKRRNRLVKANKKRKRSVNRSSLPSPSPLSLSLDTPHNEEDIKKEEKAIKNEENEEEEEVVKPAKRRRVVDEHEDSDFVSETPTKAKKQKRNQKDTAKETKAKGNKKEVEEEADEDFEEDKVTKKRKPKTVTNKIRKQGTGKKRLSKKKQEEEEEQEAQEEEKENVDQKKTPKKSTQKQQKQSPGRGLAKPASPVAAKSPRGATRRVRITKTFKDAKGYMVTEDVWEDVPIDAAEREQEENYACFRFLP